jgi:hypothetical protein
MPDRAELPNGRHQSQACRIISDVMSPHRTAGLLALPVLLLVACGGGPESGATSTRSQEVTARPPAPKPSGYPSPTVEPSETTPAADSVYDFGETAGWEDGVRATVLSATRVPSFGPYADVKGPGIKIKVKITAATTALDLTPTVDARLGADGVNAEQSYAEGCDALSDLGRLAAKRSATGTFCFAGKAATVDVSVAPTFDYDALTWSGKVT